MKRESLPVRHRDGRGRSVARHHGVGGRVAGEHARRLPPSARLAQLPRRLVANGLPHRRGRGQHGRPRARDDIGRVQDRRPAQPRLAALLPPTGRELVACRPSPCGQRMGRDVRFKWAVGVRQRALVLRAFDRRRNAGVLRKPPVAGIAAPQRHLSGLRRTAQDVVGAAPTTILLAGDGSAYAAASTAAQASTFRASAPVAASSTLLKPTYSTLEISKKLVV